MSTTEVTVEYPTCPTCGEEITRFRYERHYDRVDTVIAQEPASVYAGTTCIGVPCGHEVPRESAVIIVRGEQP